VNSFDPDRLLAALPTREITPVAASGRAIRVTVREVPLVSALGQPGEYNGFTLRERNRTASVSNWLVASNATARPPICDICGESAQHEHAENYYDLTTWIGLCVSCHVHTLHRRFTNPGKWLHLLNRHELPGNHWARLVAMAPFDLAHHVRNQGQREPSKVNYVT
jgi:hypothetical protein